MASLGTTPFDDEEKFWQETVLNQEQEDGYDTDLEANGKLVTWIQYNGSVSLQFTG